MKCYKSILIIIFIVFFFTFSLQAANYGGQLNLKFLKRPITLNPIYAANETEKIVVKQIFDNLVSLNRNGELTADLAESWEIEADGRIFKFKLRENVHFQPFQINGEPISLSARTVKAEDWKWSLEYLAAPENKSPYAKLLKNVVGYQEFRQGKSEEIKGIKILNDYMLQIELEESYAPFIYNLSRNAAALIPKKAVLNKQDFSIVPIGTGAFSIKEFSKNQIILRKFDNYWKNNYQKEKLPYLEKININFSNAKEGLDDYQQYDLYQLSPELEQEYQANNKDDNYQLKKVPENIYYYLGYNYNSSLSLGLEVQSIKEYLRSALNLNTAQPEIDLGDFIINFSNDNQISYIDSLYNLAQNRSNGDINLKTNIKKLSLINNDSKNNKMISSFIKNKLESREINVDLKHFSWSEYIKMIANNNFNDELFLMTYQYQNKYEFLADNFYSKSEKNYFNYNNRRVDNLIDYLKLVSSPKSKEQAYQIIEEILLNDNPLIFLLQGTESRLFSDRIANQDIFENIFLKDSYEKIYLK